MNGLAGLEIPLGGYEITGYEIAIAVAAFLVVLLMLQQIWQVIFGKARTRAYLMEYAKVIGNPDAIHKSESKLQNADRLNAWLNLIPTALIMGGAVAYLFFGQKLLGLSLSVAAIVAFLLKTIFGWIVSWALRVQLLGAWNALKSLFNPWRK